MLKLVLLVGIAACVGFSPMGSEAFRVGGWENIQPTPGLMRELRTVLAVDYPFVIPAVILNARMQIVAGANYDVTFQCESNKICEVRWWSKPNGEIANVVLYGCEYNYASLKAKKRALHSS